MTRIEEDSQSRFIYELCAMIIQILRCPPPATLPFPVIYSPETSTSVAPSSSMRRRTAAWPSTAAASQISPASFASLFLGISLALMLFGLVAFLIGFLLMPWVIGLVLIFYFAGLLSNLSDLGRSVVCWALSPQDDVPAWKSS